MMWEVLKVGDDVIDLNMCVCRFDYFDCVTYCK